MLGVRLGALVRTVAIATGVAVAATSAHAAIYHSEFDPLHFFGTSGFDVSSGCLSSDGLKLNDGITCSVTWLDATVTLTDVPGPATRNFDYSAFLPSTSAVISVDILFGNLAGVVSSPIGPVMLVGDPDPLFNGSFALEFSHTQVNLYRDRVLAAIATARFALVPEPGTINLLLAALGVGWLTLGLRHKLM